MEKPDPSSAAQPESPTPLTGEILPALGLVQRAILPGSRCCVALTTVSSYGAAREATRAWRAPLLAVFSAPSADLEGDSLSPVGVLATVSDLDKTPAGWVAELRAICRVRKRETLRTRPFRLARVDSWPAEGEDGEAVALLAAAVQRAVARRTTPRHCVAMTVQQQLRSASPWEIPGLVMPLLDEVPWTEWQSVLEADTVEERLAFVLAHLSAGRAPLAI
jgi:hypothetical protein